MTSKQNWVIAIGLAALVVTAVIFHRFLSARIAYDAAQDRIFVTGKLWPTVFEIRLWP